MQVLAFGTARAVSRDKCVRQHAAGPGLTPSELAAGAVRGTGDAAVAGSNGSDAKRKAQEKWRERDREVRMIDQVNVRIPAKYKTPLKRFSALLRQDETPWKAFKAAFPRGYADLLNAARRREQKRRLARGEETRAAPRPTSQPAGRTKPKRRDQPGGR